ncbi:MAG: PH domain-containing protein [Micropruina sp.]|nr:PH domain-containing protein [Micropruina sp.]
MISPPKIVRNHLPRLPSMGGVGEDRLPPEALAYWRVHAVISAVGLLVVLGAAFGLVWPGALFPWGLVVLGLVTSVAAIEWFFYLPFRFNNYSYTVVNEYIYIAQGRFLRRSVIIPSDKILSVGSVQGPVMRKLGVTRLGVTCLLGVEHFGPFPSNLATNLRDRIMANSKWNDPAHG